MGEHRLCSCGHEWGEHYQRYDGEHGCSQSDDDDDDDDYGYYGGGLPCGCNRFRDPKAIIYPQYGRAYSGTKLHISYEGEYPEHARCGVYMARADHRKPDGELCSRCVKYGELSPKRISY